MFEDKILLWKFKSRGKDALRAIYDKYADDLLNLAANLLNDPSAAEDVVQDVFVTLAQSADKINLRENLKGYLLTCVANRSHDCSRKSVRHKNALGKQKERIQAESINPVQTVICLEELEKLSCAMTELPYEQREVIVLRLHSNLKFKQIAKIRNVSIKTVQSQYRYGLEKLRSMMNSEVKK
ncbi:MAG: sigma-70 family RNA polymerase sigma factor [Sedimentisphaerales bacterium]|nr:sigma-70 family RNA polymerase sigma factor [Sedimentisphaerales bacterium]